MRNRPFVEMGSTSSTFTGELAGGVRFEDSTGTPVYEEVADPTLPDDVSSFSYDHSVELPEVFQKLSKLPGIMHRQLPFWGQTALDLLTGQYPFVIADVGMFLAGRGRSEKKHKAMVEVQPGNGLYDLIDPYRPEIEMLFEIVGKFDTVSLRHSTRTAELAQFLIDSGFVKDEHRVFVLAALLHDVGKLSIPSDILHKPGALTSSERKILREHPKSSFRIVCAMILQMISRLDPERAAELERSVGSEDPDKRDHRPILAAVDEMKKRFGANAVEHIVRLREAALILVRHHEYEPNGMSYPRSGIDRRNGSEDHVDHEERHDERRTEDASIVRLGRMLSIIDQYEAMTSHDREFYRELLTPQEAAAELRKKFELPDDAAVIDALVKRDAERLSPDADLTGLPAPVAESLDDGGLTEDGVGRASSSIRVNADPNQGETMTGVIALDGVLQAFGRTVRLGMAPLRLERAGFKAAMKLGSWPVADMHRINDLTINDKEGNQVPVRIYRPSDSQNLPVVVFFHGGGFMFGDLDDFDGFASQIAKRTGAIVVSVDYPLSPEHKFPDAVESSYSALEWVHSHAVEIGADPERMAVAGDSAGANIAAALTLMSRDRNGPRLLFQLLFSPVTNMQDVMTRSFAENDGFLISTNMMKVFERSLIPRGADRTDPRLSPYLAESHSGLPPAYIVVAGMDPLRDDGIRYAEKLDISGVPVKLHVSPGMMHDHVLFPILGEETDKAMDEGTGELKRALGSLRQPFTGGPIPYDKIDEAWMRSLIKDTRRFLKERIDSSKGGFHVGDDLEGLRNEIMEDVERGEARDVIERTNAIIAWYGSKHRLGPGYVGGMRHRFMRLVTSYRELPSILQRSRTEHDLRSLTSYSPMVKTILSETNALFMLDPRNRNGVRADLGAIRKTSIDYSGDIDFEAFEEIVEELMLNAYKNANEKIVVEWDEKEKTLIITNDGRWIRPEDGDPFRPGVSIAGREGVETGGGYGLSNAKADAEAQGWELTYTSEPGRTEFRLRVAEKAKEPTSFPHPVTGESIPVEMFNDRYMTKLILEVRNFYRNKINDIVRRWKAGEDPAALAEYVNEDKEAKLVLERTSNLLQWYYDDDIEYRGMYHRFFSLSMEYTLGMTAYLESVDLDELPEDLSRFNTRLESIVKRIEQSFHRRITKKSLNVEHFNLDKLRMSERTDIDVDMLEVTVEELILNAIKYADKNIRVEWDEATQTIIITNDGRWIEPGQDPFRAGSRGKGTEGVDSGGGFGLSNAKADAEAQGWELTYTSEPGRTEFRLRVAEKAKEPTSFPHPLTGEPVPVEELTYERIKEMVREIRREYKGKLRELVTFVRESTDVQEMNRILEERQRSENEAYQREIDEFEAILDWYDNKHSLGGKFTSAMRHRVTRLMGMNVAWMDNILTFGPKAVDDISLDYSAGPSTIVNDIRSIFSDDKKVNPKKLHVEYSVATTEIDESKDVNFEVLEEIVEELIVNAYRYADSSIKVEWDAATRSLVVINDGPGIPKGLDVFKAGVRGNHPWIEGTGFGLSNAKADAEAQGWELTYTSEPGRTEFRLRIPEKEERIRRQLDARIGDFVVRFDAIRSRMPTREELEKPGDKTNLIARLKTAKAEISALREATAFNDYFNVNVMRDGLQWIRIDLFNHSTGSLWSNLKAAIDYLTKNLSGVDLNPNVIEQYEGLRTRQLIGGTMPIIIREAARIFRVELNVSPEADDLLDKLSSDDFKAVVDNLLENTDKYRPNDGKKPAMEVSVVASYEGKGHNSTYKHRPAIAFRDNAGGIPPDIAAKIGQEQVHGDPTKPGSGRGLLMTYQLIEKMGGHIWFETTPGVGTTFYINIPSAMSDIRPEALPHPLTGETIPFGNFTDDMIKGLVKETRGFYKQRMNSVLERLNAGADPLQLGREIDEDDENGESSLVHDRMTAILRWYDVEHGLKWTYLGAMRHRFYRLANLYSELGYMLRKGKLERIAPIRPSYTSSVNVIIGDLVAKFLYDKRANNGVVARSLVRKTSIDEDPDIDFETFEEIAEELILNAVKNADNDVTVDWDDEKRTLVIVNDGRWIDPADGDPLQPGVSFAGREGVETGGGFGLSNAKADAEAQGWELTYTSEPGRTEFRLRIPEKEERLSRQVDMKLAEFSDKLKAIMERLPTKDEILAATDKKAMAARLEGFIKELEELIASSGINDNFGLVSPTDLQGVRIQMYRHSVKGHVQYIFTPFNAYGEDVEAGGDVNVNFENYERYRQSVPVIDAKMDLYDYLHDMSFSMRVGITIMDEAAYDLISGRNVGLLADVIRNIVENVKKYAPKSSAPLAWPEIEVLFVPSYFGTGDNSQYNGLSALAFSDHAGGIPPDIAAKIGQEQVHGDPTKPGSGRGFLMTYQLIEKMGGHIWFETTPGVGTTFYIWLPEFDVGSK